MTIRTTVAASLAIALMAAGVAALLTAAPAFAHARYKSSTPGTGEVLTTSPVRVDITFTQQIQKVSGTYAIDVNRDRGASVTGGTAVVDDADRTHLSVPLQTGLGPGRYVVNWKNTSDADGDPATGGFSFYINTQPNTVDLANDAQLAQIGFEDVTATAAAAGTPSTSTASTPAPAGTPASRPTTAASGTQSPAVSAATPIPTSTSTSSGGSSNTVAYVIIATIAVIAVVGLGVWQYATRRGS